MNVFTQEPTTKGGIQDGDGKTKMYRTLCKHSNSVSVVCLQKTSGKYNVVRIRCSVDEFLKVSLFICPFFS